MISFENWFTSWSKDVQGPYDSLSRWLFWLLLLVLEYLHFLEKENPEYFSRNLKSSSNNNIKSRAKGCGHILEGLKLKEEYRNKNLLTLFGIIIT